MRDKSRRNWPSRKLQRKLPPLLRLRDSDLRKKQGSLKKNKRQLNENDWQKKKQKDKG